MDRPRFNTLGLCAGVGMLDIGTHAGAELLGWEPRAVAYVERDAYPASVLLGRMEDAALGPAPIWCGDLAGFDPEPFRGMVDCIVAGLPCQPYSCAGRQQGNSDARSWGDGDGPLPHALRIIAGCNPAMVFLENVPTWIRGGWFRPFGERLCELGYALCPPLFIRAKDAGASHKRMRAFVMAYRPGFRSWRLPARQGTEGGRTSDVDRGRGTVVDAERNGGRFDVAGRGPDRGTVAGGTGPELADANHQTGSAEHGNDARRRAGSGQDNRPVSGERGEDGSELGNAPGSGRERRVNDDAPRSAGGSADMGNASGIGRGPGNDALHPGPTGPDGRQSAGSSVGRGELADAERARSQGTGPTDADGRGVAGACGPDWGIFAPPPNADWASIPEFVWPAVEPRLRVLVDGDSLVLDASRANQLRASGNGCVPIQAAVAFVHLVRTILG